LPGSAPVVFYLLSQTRRKEAIETEKEVVTEIPSVISAEGSDTWPEIARTPEIGPEAMIVKTEETEGCTETTEMRALDVTIARNTGTWQEIVREVHNNPLREKVRMLQLRKGRTLCPRLQTGSERSWRS